MNLARRAACEGRSHGSHAAFARHTMRCRAHEPLGGLLRPCSSLGIGHLALPAPCFQGRRGLRSELRTVRPDVVTWNSMLSACISRWELVASWLQLVSTQVLIMLSVF